MPYFQMTKLALKWVLSKPTTSRYPFEPRKIISRSRGQVIFTKDHCVFCTVCAKKCPTAALLVNRAQKRWAIDRLRCISCGACVDACPKDSITLATDHALPVVTRDREWF
jgi:formate hydrogenlyase subunit 6/NADH:ubiquinone oxidoreductase subunit I